MVRSVYGRSVDGEDVHGEGVHGEGVHGEDVHGEGVYGEGVHAKKHAAKGRCKTCEDRGDETDHLQLVLLLFLLQHPVSYLLEMALGVKSKQWLKEQGHPPSSILASHSPCSLQPSLSVHFPSSSTVHVLFSEHPN